jgi:hypothetical protein
MARVTLNGEIAQFSLKCEVNPSEWNPGTGRAIGKSASAQKLNGLLDNFRASLTQHYREISDREATITAEKVRNAFLGIQMRNDSLLELFDEPCKNLEIQVGKGVSRDTHQKYLRIGSRLRDFMNHKYHISDINLKEINHSFHSCSQNTTAKFMQRVRTIVLIAKSNGWIHADPFANYKLQTEKTEREFLNERELESIFRKNHG